MFQLLIPALLLLSFEATAQTAIDLTKNICGSSPDTVKVVLFMPTTITVRGTPTRVSTPICASLGASLRVITLAGVLTVETAAAIPILPKAAVERITLPPEIPATQETFDITLAKTPALNTHIIVWLDGSVISMSKTDAVVTDGSKILRVTLPRYRPFTSDIVTVAYWTLE